MPDIDIANFWSYRVCASILRTLSRDNCFVKRFSSNPRCNREFNSSLRYRWSMPKQIRTIRSFLAFTSRKIYSLSLLGTVAQTDIFIEFDKIDTLEHLGTLKGVVLTGSYSISWRSRVPKEKSRGFSHCTKRYVCLAYKFSRSTIENVLRFVKSYFLSSLSFDNSWTTGSTIRGRRATRNNTWTFTVGKLLQDRNTYTSRRIRKRVKSL